ncbi:MAG: amidohydrolase [Chloroflexi bacterium]|nr:amidohydrolase [Chloroflexota bacterium]
MQTKQEIIQWLEQNRSDFIDMADRIWEYAEISHREFKSSKLQADYLEKEGFKIEWEIGGLQTAFTAVWGSGKPVIGFLGEYDALEGLSQKRLPVKEPIQEGAPGHGCGHNLLGTGVLASTVAVKRWLENTGTQGTVRYYGCPAEENTYGKTFMARAGAFNDLDAAFNYHPGSINMASKSSAVGVNDIKFRFFGRTAHAGGSPHLGRSALDAVELMNVGVNYLREHVTSNVRIHYAITHGGDLPNVVPAEAEVWYFIRAHKPQELEEVTNRVRKIAEGAAMMTETRLEEHFRSACSAVLSNHTLADLQYEAMKLVGPMEFTAEEIAYAEKINSGYPAENLEAFYTMAREFKSPPEVAKFLEENYGAALIAINLPPLDEGKIETGSTDVGDVSQITPISMLNTACFPTALSGHCWGTVAASGSSIGHKGMMHAAKIMALAAVDCFTNPEHLHKARAEFEKATKDYPYRSPLPAYVQPPRYPNPYK